MKIRQVVRAILVITPVFFLCAVAFAEKWPKELLQRITVCEMESMEGKAMPEKIDEIKTITSEEAYKLWKAKKAVVLDCRPKKSFDAEHIPGSEWFYDQALLKDPAAADKLDKKKEYLVYCTGST